MGIADFFLGKKPQGQASLNDLVTASRASTPNIFLPGFSITQRQVDAPGTIDGVPQTRQEFTIGEDRNIRRARKSQQALAAQLSGQLGEFGFDQPIAADPERAAEIEQATFQRALNLLQPGIDRNRRREEQRLSNRALPEGGEARRVALEDLVRDEQAQLENLALSSVLAGEQALTSDVGRQQASRQQFLSQLAQLLFPQTGAPGGVPGPTLSGGDILAPGAQDAAIQGQRNQGIQSLLAGLIAGGGRVGAAFAGG